MDFPPILTAAQCRDARMLIRWQAIELAVRAAVPLAVAEAFEAGRTPAPAARLLRRTFEANGVTFPADDPLGRPLIDGMAHNSRTEAGLQTWAEPGSADWRFLYPPLPEPDWAAFTDGARHDGPVPPPGMVDPPR